MAGSLKVRSVEIPWSYVEVVRAPRSRTVSIRFPRGGSSDTDFTFSTEDEAAALTEYLDASRSAEADVSLFEFVQATGKAA